MRCRGCGCAVLLCRVVGGVGSVRAAVYCRANVYIKRHAVARGEKRYVYLRLVQAYRDDHGRVRHRVLRTLGREDELKASGQLEQLMGSFARLDPPLVGVRREVGPLLLAWQFIGELD